MQISFVRPASLVVAIALVGLANVALAQSSPKPKQLKPQPQLLQRANAAPKKGLNVQQKPYGKTQSGKQITEYTLTNTAGMRVKLIDYGAIVTSVETPDRDGKLKNITLGFDNLASYEQRHPYFGATVGRYCNRIAGGKFSLDGKQYTLATNNGPNHLHGGEVGFDRVVWQAEPVKTADSVGVKFTYVSEDGEEGYPGKLISTATYSLNNANELTIDFSAKAEQATVVNLTNHCYWNLAGAGAGQILNHELMIAADEFLPVDATLIPTGKTALVKGTPLDFTTAKAVGADLKQIEADPQGYDHCFVLRGQDGKMALAARVKDPSSGRVMEIHTTQPGIQFYSGNFLDGSESNGGFKQYEGFCLETQHYPDSPNQPAFPTTVLKPGETYHQTTVHKFSVE